VKRVLPLLIIFSLFASCTNPFMEEILGRGKKKPLSGESEEMEEPPGGSGTAEDPFRVRNAEELRYVGKGEANADTFYQNWTLDVYYKQTANITLSGEWTPIGDSNNNFTGSYNGGGHTITGLTGSQGMFGNMGTGGRVENLGLINVNINSAGQNVGGIAGNGYIIQNCFVTGNITGTSTVGGIAGLVNNGTVTNCYAAVSVTASSQAAGIVWLAPGGTIRNCVVLNDSLTNQGTSTNIGRVGGSGGGQRQNNYAWIGMMLTADGSSVTPAAPTLNGMDGADLTTADAKNYAWWTDAGKWSANGIGAWDFSSGGVWRWVDGRMPSLANSYAPPWPSYLQ